MILRQVNYVLFFLVLFINIASQMKFGNNSFLYVVKFTIFVIHLIFMLLSIAKEKIIVPRQIKVLGFSFYLWFLLMTMSTFHLRYFNDIISAYLVIISYILLFIYSLIIFPNFMAYKKISYQSIARVAYFAVFAALIVATYLGYGDSESTHFDPISLRDRYMGFFQHPNTLGLYAFMGVYLSYLMHQLSKNKMYLLSYLFCFYFIYMSLSRTALFATIIFTLATLMQKYSFKLLRSLMNPLVATYLISFIMLIVLLIDWPSLLQAIDNGTSNRLTVWTELLKQSDSISKVIFGQGAVKSDASKDNYYVLVLINSGILGLGVFLLIVVTIFKYLVENYCELSKLISIMYCIFLVYSLAESVFYTLGNVLSIFIWISVALSMYANTPSNNKLSIPLRDIDNKPHLPNVVSEYGFISSSTKKL